MGSRSSWRPDRFETACICKKCVKNSGNIRKSVVKVMKESDLYVEEYGKEAYETWKKREEEIDKMMKSFVCSRYEIIRLREENYRQMKKSAGK